MDGVFRGAAVYLVLLVLVRITGRRTLAELSSFDFILLLIISEATQQALLGQDYSITHAFVVIVTLLFIDIVLSLLKRRSQRLARWVDGLPLVVMDEGRLRKDLMEKARVDEEDILEQARATQGVGTLDEVRYAVLERNGGISILPKKEP